jgi:preprotein translocase subunit YajC
MIASLKKGDKVVTVGGIYGTIAGVKEKEGTFILKVDDNVKIEISKSAVARKLS